MLIVASGFSMYVGAQDDVDAPAPYKVYGTVTCKDLNYCDDALFAHITKDWQLKLNFTPPSGLSGPYPFTTGSGRILSGGATPDPNHFISVTRSGNFFNWSANRTISAVIVKGGSYSNVYPYNPASLGGSPQGNALTTPGTGNVIAHITFCFEQPVGPSAAVVTVGGRVTTVEGNGMAKTYVSMTDEDGRVRVTITNGFGYYSFDDVEVGKNYIIEPVRKGYQFSPRLISLTDEMPDVDFIAIQ